jgi:hypothetical protein
MMTKLISFSIASFILVQSFNIHLVDVFELKNLMEHAEYHKTTYGDDLMSFLAKHYGDQKAEHNRDKQEEQHHRQLPFNHGFHLDIAPFDLINTTFHQLSDVNILDPDISKFFYQDFYTYLQNSDIFQPPQQV